MARTAVVTALLLGLMCSRICASEAPQDGAKADLNSNAPPRACPVPILVRDKGSKGIEPDTTWYGFGPAITGARAKGSKDRWVVDYT